MAMAVILFPATSGEPALQPRSLQALAALGVTGVALVSDEATAGLVLEGWAFDPSRVTEAALAVIGAREGVQTLRPLVEMAVSTARPKEV